MFFPPKVLGDGSKFCGFFVVFWCFFFGGGGCTMEPPWKPLQFQGTMCYFRIVRSVRFYPCKYSWSTLYSTGFLPPSPLCPTPSRLIFPMPTTWCHQHAALPHLGVCHSPLYISCCAECSFLWLQWHQCWSPRSPPIRSASSADRLPGVDALMSVIHCTFIRHCSVDCRLEFLWED